eukprot:TRINITY_DN5191_c0_g1_i1.p1 TRINITY_DN5191_c0_g1~~TRINITY_DN5191_c0_g1_i1.p1  ORF type:complete len:320 (-),score=71.87 TRINITY_DN5191_c0_g1_i1:565-1524(-)
MNPSSTIAQNYVQELNLRVLRRFDPRIASIHAKTELVHLYCWKEIDSRWEGTNITGPLFIYERDATPQYGMIILDRKEPREWVAPIDHEFQLLNSMDTEAMIVFLIQNQVYAFWITNAADKDQLRTAISAISEDSSRPSEIITADESSSVPHQSPPFIAANVSTPRDTSESIHHSRSLPEEYEFLRGLMENGQSHVEFTNSSKPMHTSSLGGSMDAHHIFTTAASSSFDPVHNLVMSTPSRLQADGQLHAAHISGVVLQTLDQRRLDEFPSDQKDGTDVDVAPHLCISKQNLVDAVTILLQDEDFVEHLYKNYLSSLRH